MKFKNILGIILKVLIVFEPCDQGSTIVQSFQDCYFLNHGRSPGGGLKYHGMLAKLSLPFKRSYSTYFGVIWNKRKHKKLHWEEFLIGSCIHPERV